MAVSLTNIFMAEIETKLIQQGKIKPREWKRYIGDIFSLWDATEKCWIGLLRRANYLDHIFKFTAEISENQITFLNTTVFKGERFAKDFILNIKTHYKPTETLIPIYVLRLVPPTRRKT